MADMIAGTPHYVAPEQVRGEAVTSCSDIYSLGVLAYVLFLGRAPFDAESSAEILTQQVQELPPPPKERWAEIPVELERLILGMLEKAPADRPRMPAVIESLRVLRRLAVPPPPVPSARGTEPAPIALGSAPTEISAAVPPSVSTDLEVELELVSDEADGNDVIRAAPPAFQVSFTAPQTPVDVLGRQMMVLPPLQKRWWIGTMVTVTLLLCGLVWRSIVGGHEASASPAMVGQPVKRIVAPVTPEPASVPPLTRAEVSWDLPPLALLAGTACEPAIAECPTSE